MEQSSSKQATDITNNNDNGLTTTNFRLDNTAKSTNISSTIFMLQILRILRSRIANRLSLDKRVSRKRPATPSQEQQPLKIATVISPIDSKIPLATPVTYRTPLDF